MSRSDYGPKPSGPTHPPRVPPPPPPPPPPAGFLNAATFATGVVMGFAIVWKLIPRRRVA